MLFVCLYRSHRTNVREAKLSFRLQSSFHQIHHSIGSSRSSRISSEYNWNDSLFKIHYYSETWVKTVQSFRITCTVPASSGSGIQIAITTSIHPFVVLMLMCSNDIYNFQFLRNNLRQCWLLVGEYFTFISNHLQKYQHRSFVNDAGHSWNSNDTCTISACAKSNKNVMSENRKKFCH